MTQLVLTRHAQARACQRGIPHHVLEAMLMHADFEAPVGDGCTVLRITRRQLQDRDLRAGLGATADRLSSLAVIVADETGEIVTVMHDHGRAGGRRYRRAH
jgi:hypothetical protein